MLQKEAVENRTLDLIRQLCEDKKLEGFCLAGGTALSLYLGHRRSEDIDLFSLQGFNAHVLLEYLESSFGFSV